MAFQANIEECSTSLLFYVITGDSNAMFLFTCKQISYCQVKQQRIMRLS